MILLLDLPLQNSVGGNLGKVFMQRILSNPENLEDFFLHSDQPTIGAKEPWHQSRGAEQDSN